MKNKIFGFICILVMTALMAACGSDAVYPVSKMDSGTQTSESILEYEDTEDSDAAQTGKALPQEVKVKLMRKLTLTEICRNIIQRPMTDS